MRQERQERSALGIDPETPSGEADVPERPPREGAPGRPSDPPMGPTQSVLAAPGDRRLGALTSQQPTRPVERAQPLATERQRRVGADEEAGVRAEAAEKPRVAVLRLAHRRRAAVRDAQPLLRRELDFTPVVAEAGHDAGPRPGRGRDAVDPERSEHAESQQLGELDAEPALGGETPQDVVEVAVALALGRAARAGLPDVERDALLDRAR